MTLLQEIIDGASGSEMSVPTLLRKVKVLSKDRHVGEPRRFTGSLAL